MYKAKVNFLWFKQGQVIDNIEPNWIKDNLVEKVELKVISKEEMIEEFKKETKLEEEVKPSFKKGKK